MTDPLAVQFEKALDLLDDLTEGMLPLGGVSDVWYERISLWKMTARSLVNEHLKEGHMGNSTGEKVAAIRQAWEAAWPTDPPITHDSGPLMSLDLLATIAVNVLCDWDKRPTHPFFIPPATNPLDVLRCSGCPHMASDHGFRFNPINGAITYSDARCQVDGCECEFVQTVLPGMHLDPDGTLIP